MLVQMGDVFDRKGPTVRMRLWELRRILGRFLLTEMTVPGLTPWPPDSLEIPEVTDDDLAAKVGPFERRLAYVLGGQVVGGGSKSYDIEANGVKYEVKKPDKANEIRAGGEGALAFSEAKARIEAACRTIDEVFGEGSRQMTRAAVEEVMSPEALATIDGFVPQIPAIMKGNLSTSRMKAFHQVLRLISQAVKAEGAGGSKQLLMGDDEHVVDREIDNKTYVKIGQMLDVPPEELGSSSNDLLSITFSSEAFRDPDTFMANNWSHAVSPSAVFKAADSVAFVADAGYRLVARDELDNVMVFNRIANGRMLFRVTG